MTRIPTVLEKIIEVKKVEVAALLRAKSATQLRDEMSAAEPPRGFLAALKQRARTNTALVAEVKKASPSKGIIRADFDPIWIAERYEAGGASCLSVLTDEQFFQGSLDYLRAVRRAVPLPLLRKDFTIDALQLYEARAAGADCILLIAACLDPHHLADLHAEAVESCGLDVLVEIHDEHEWEAVLGAMAAPPPLTGINNRNLHDFSVTLETTCRVAPEVTGAGAFLVAESGIFTPRDVAIVREAGAGAILVGESLMREKDPGEAAKRLLAK